MCFLGLAKDRKKVSREIINARVQRTGDGSIRSGWVTNYRLCNWYWGVNTKTERSNMYRIFLVLGWWLPCFWLLPEINIGFKETVWISFSRFEVLLLTINISQELGSASTVFSAKNQRDTRRMKDDWIWFDSIRTTKHICRSDLLK